MKSIRLKCDGCAQEWFIDHEAGQLEETESPTRTCKYCEQTYCDECFDSDGHECMMVARP